MSEEAIEVEDEAMDVEESVSLMLTLQDVGKARSLCSSTREDAGPARTTMKPAAAGARASRGLASPARMTGKRAAAASAARARGWASQVAAELVPSTTLTGASSTRATALGLAA